MISELGTDIATSIFRLALNAFLKRGLHLANSIYMQLFIATNSFIYVLENWTVQLKDQCSYTHKRHYSLNKLHSSPPKKLNHIKTGQVN